MNYAGKKVKVLASSKEEWLENAVNKFLATHECVVDIQYQFAKGDYCSLFSAMIIYE